MSVNSTEPRLQTTVRPFGLASSTRHTQGKLKLIVFTEYLLWTNKSIYSIFNFYTIAVERRYSWFWVCVYMPSFVYLYVKLMYSKHNKTTQFKLIKLIYLCWSVFNYKTDAEQNMVCHKWWPNHDAKRKGYYILNKRGLGSNVRYNSI